MIDTRALWSLAVAFTPLSLLAFGGGQAIISDIHDQSVLVHGWISEREFAELFALSRAAPGPSTLIVALIGWRAAGLAGALAAALAIFLPSSLLIYAVGSWWRRHRQSPVARAVERGLMPVAIGLVFAGALTLLRTLPGDALHALTVVLALLLLSTTRIGPYALLLPTAAAYAALALI